MGRGTFLPWICLYRQHVLLNCKIVATDLHFLLGTEGFDLSIGTSSDSGVLDVEAARVLVIATLRAKLKNNEKTEEDSLLLKFGERLVLPVNVVQALTKVAHSVTT